MDLCIVDDVVWYAPDFGGNRDKPDAARMAVKIQPLTAAEARAIERAHVKVRAGSVDVDGGELALALVKRCVVEVRNLTLTRVKASGETSEQVTTVDGLVGVLEHAPGLLVDIALAIQNHNKLAEGMAGKSDALSGSPTTPTTARGPGAAPSAGEPNRETDPQSLKMSGDGSATATASPTSTYRGRGILSYADAPGQS